MVIMVVMVMMLVVSVVMVRFMMLRGVMLISRELNSQKETARRGSCMMRGIIEGMPSTVISMRRICRRRSSRVVHRYCPLSTQDRRSGNATSRRPGEYNAEKTGLKYSWGKQKIKYQKKDWDLLRLGLGCSCLSAAAKSGDEL
ncbi:uncharacterized protein LY89DRAFT_54429 [Mollisia scopiformis]|uniref:Uncharacterized protein n=1 Tax=Mollisia scopiformis TaxID=149040 RepID=A0A194XBD8_MOLSC|nr:uncharacterized protein LY89DRAFT_54429 [Mollisia scopiformis]KUJ17481.1 hypothetical protein LY89DRAFT_54429 [Mollisia scopiformis]